MTTAPEAKARIIALLQAAPEMAGVQVQPKGPIRESDVTPEMLYLGRIRGEQEWAALGKLTRHESYTIDVFIRNWVAEAGNTELDTDTRCWEIFSDMETVLRGDPSLGGLLQGNIQVKTFDQDTHATIEPVGFRGWLDAQFLVETHLRLP
jgi:hypothetical protein